MKPYSTPKGIVIGSAWTPRPPQMSDDAVRIQKALLGRNVTDSGHRAVPYLGGVILAVLSFLLFTGRLG
jgi:hypothetical protein